MLTKNKNAKTGQTSPFLGSTKIKYFALRVVWVGESKNGLRFEIGPNHDNVPTRSQLLTHRQSSCKYNSTSHKGCAVCVNI